MKEQIVHNFTLIIRTIDDLQPPRIEIHRMQNCTDTTTRTIHTTTATTTTTGITTIAS